MSTNYGPLVPTDGLILCLDGGNNKSYPSGSGIGTWYDIGGKGHDGTISAGTHMERGGAWCLDFSGVNGTTGRVDCGTDPVVTGSFSVIMWVYPDENKVSQGSMAINTYAYQGGSGTNDAGFYFGQVWDGDYFRLTVNSGTGTNPNANLNSFFTNYLNEWSCMAGVFSAGGYVRLFKDGGQIANSSTAITGSAYVNYPLMVARRSAQAQSNWPGGIGYVSYYDRALSNDEILQVYAAMRTRFGI